MNEDADAVCCSPFWRRAALFTPLGHTVVIVVTESGHFLYTLSSPVGICSRWMPGCLLLLSSHLPWVSSVQLQLITDFMLKTISISVCVLACVLSRKPISSWLLNIIIVVFIVIVPAALIVTTVN